MTSPLARLLGAVFLALPGVLVAGCTHVEKRPAATGPPADRFAWITDGEFTVSVGARIIGPIVGGFGQPGNVLWTDSGNYAAAVSINTALDETLVIVDARTGASRRLPCGCTRAEPVGGDRVAYVDERHTARILDPGSSAEPAAIGLPLPRGLLAVQLTAVAGDVLLVTGNKTGKSLDESAGDPETMFVVRPGRAPAEMRSSAPILWSDAVGGLDGDRHPAFLLTRPPDDSRCPEQLAWFYRPDADTMTRVPYAPGPVAASKTLRAYAGDAWWDRQGRVNTMLAITRCDGDIRELAQPSSWWQWDGRRWTQVEKRSLMAARTLTSGDRVEISVEDNVNLLYKVHGTTRTMIGEEVLAVAAPPA